MLYLILHLGGDRYAIPAHWVVEVLPLLKLKSIPHAPPGIAGVFSYRGKPVPVVDFQLLASGEPSKSRMTTRIAVVTYPKEGADSHLLGIMAEQLTETLRAEEEDFQPPPVRSTGAAYLGDVYTDAAGILQRVKIVDLLPLELRQSLFEQATGAA